MEDKERQLVRLQKQIEHEQQGTEVLEEEKERLEKKNEDLSQQLKATQAEGERDKEALKSLITELEEHLKVAKLEAERKEKEYAERGKYFPVVILLFSLFLRFFYYLFI